MSADLPQLEDLLKDGFTKRMANEYLSILQRERTSGLFDMDYLTWSHAHGFTAESACAYGLDDSNIDNYLSDYDYWRLWPLNDWQRIWINDKLTLHALLSDSSLAHYLPDYYYYSRPQGLLALDGSDFASGMDGFLATLRERGEFACKPCNGSEANGFFKLSYAQDSYYINNKEASQQDIIDMVHNNPNYIFTEYLRPSTDMARIDPLIHTLRAVVINPNGSDPQLVANYLRFAVDESKTGIATNYQAPTTADIRSFNAHVDLETGHFNDGRLVYANKVVAAPRHPDSNIMVNGDIPCWDETVQMMMRIALKVGACEYLGFDACITDDGPRIMEINSHSGVKYLQVFTPFKEIPSLWDYYQQKLAAIDALDDAKRARRNAVVR